MEHGFTDQRRRAAGPGLSWSQWWSLSWWHDDRVSGLIGGTIRLELFPYLGRSRVWGSVVGERRRLVTLVEHDAPMPRGSSLEVRASGLWIDLIVQTPGRHLTVGLEAFGVAVDDPDEACTRAWGDRTPLGLDLEWEFDPDAALADTVHGAGRPAVVHGEVLVADEVIDLDGRGWCTSGWGDGDPLAETPLAVGTLDDGRVVDTIDLTHLPSHEVVARSPVAVTDVTPAWTLEQALVRYDGSGGGGAGWTWEAALPSAGPAQRPW